jgi:hypothetical protein
MIQKLNLEISRHEKSHKQSEASGMPTQDLDAMVLGLKTMVRAVFVATNAHIVRAPMAFFLARHQSRFWYSHEFTYCNLMDFLKGPESDFCMSSNEEGVPFIK